MDLIESIYKKNNDVFIMSGYKILLQLYSNVETWRELTIPENITFKQLHQIIQKIFGFYDYHMYDFRIPEEISEDTVDLNSIIQNIDYEHSNNVKINEIFNDNSVLLYVYDFGDNWEIVISVMDKIDYDETTALITDFKGKYNPLDDMGGIPVFEEIMDCIGDEEDLTYVLDEYGMDMSHLNEMDFTKKFKKRSVIKF